MDVKNPHAYFNDLENNVCPEESNDELLDQAWDDHTGASLDGKKVKEVRQLEMEYYDNMHVFNKVLVARCWERTGKAPLKARWVYIDKCTRYRSRWVAKQFKGSDSEEWFAAAPPIEALRALISHSMSGPKKRAFMVCDVSRAFFYALVQHEIYVELCQEAKKTVEDNNTCAKLRMNMYGTKAAVQNWQKKVQETMATLGFSIGKALPVLFCQHQKSLKCLVHGDGDDFVVSGCETSWGPSLEINTTILCDGPGMSKEVKMLNGELCCDGVGISYEPDRKHAEAIIRETGASNWTSLKITMSKESKNGVRDKTDDIVEKRKLGKLGMKEQPLIEQIFCLAETARYRALAATANFLAIDRADFVYCAKELTRHMATPTTADWEKVVRLERYLKNRPRVRLQYKFR